uniref:Uncharacterized protein n=1 Tax=Candidatus Nitrotoga fabula TaxID=2182327 RepID=A0A2X0QX73_9PROT|nr:protein of unknown function [Candidatus Nitrotoga fabula]
MKEILPFSDRMDLAEAVLDSIHNAFMYDIPTAGLANRMHAKKGNCGFHVP